MTTRDRGNWQALSVHWRIALPKSASNLSKDELKRARLTAFLDALEKGELPEWARMSYLAWKNPDADHEPEPIMDDSDHALEELPTLNRGGWLAAKVRSDLEDLGGEFRLDSKQTNQRKKTKKRSKSEGKKLANVARKKGKRVGKNRRGSSRGKR